DPHHEPGLVPAHDEAEGQDHKRQEPDSRTFHRQFSGIASLARLPSRQGLAPLALAICKANRGGIAASSLPGLRKDRANPFFLWSRVRSCGIPARGTQLAPFVA